MQEHSSKTMAARIAVVAVIMAGILTACDSNTKESRAKAALEQKYHEKFEVAQIYPQKIGQLYYEVQAYAAEDPETRFMAYVDTKDDGVSDTYVERRVCTAIARQAAENLYALPGNCHVFAHAVGPQPIADDPEISIYDYMQLDGYNRVLLYVYINPVNANAVSVYESLKGIFSGMEYLIGSVRLYVVDEGQLEAVREYFNTNDDIHSAHMELTEDAFTLDIPYNNGVITMAGDDFMTAVAGAL